MLMEMKSWELRVLINWRLVKPLVLSKSQKYEHWVACPLTVKWGKKTASKSQEMKCDKNLELNSHDYVFKVLQNLFLFMGFY